MAKITIEETSAEATPPAGPAATDARGRTISVRKLTAFDRMVLSEIVGGENSLNETFWTYAVLAYHVTGIDGEAVPRPSTKAQVMAVVKRLDDEGLLAVRETVQPLYATPEESEALLKNASGTPAS